MSSRTRLAAAALGATAVVATPLAVSASTYVVRPGDSLSEIAVRHATTVEAIAEANHLADAAALRAGQMLQIPTQALSLPQYTSESHDIDLHTVGDGEQLFQVARYFGVDPTVLARTNGIGVNEHLEPGAILHVPGRLGRVNALLTQVSNRVGVNADVVAAVAWMESGWQQNLISATGAVGIMQLEPFAGEWVSRYLAGRRLDIHLASDNVAAGALLIRHLLAVHNGDNGAALAAYYQGDASITRNGVYDDTRRYVRVVSELLAAA